MPLKSNILFKLSLQLVLQGIDCQTNEWFVNKRLTYRFEFLDELIIVDGSHHICRLSLLYGFKI